VGKRNHGYPMPTHICVCGLKAFSTKKTAKRAAHVRDQKPRAVRVSS
jgi:hypothetical protein